MATTLVQALNAVGRYQTVLLEGVGFVREQDLVAMGRNAHPEGEGL